MTNIEQIISLLLSAYGPRDCQAHNKPLDELLLTILSQNTSDLNSRRAFSSLRAAFPDWEKLAAADEKDIAAAIRIGGLEKVKSRRILQILGEIKRERGSLDIGFLNELPLDEARDWLRGLPGVGDKTANCVLLFSFCRPALPVDTHIFRVSKRLGLVDSKASVEKVHRLLEAVVPPEQVHPFHVLMIEHGRQTCKAQRPRCIECVLAKICPSYEVFVGTGTDGEQTDQD